MKEKTTSRVGVVFPGQGSQRPGMGKDFYDNISTSRDTYREASEILGWDVAAMCFGEDKRLNLTEYAQPCILATEIAMFRGLRFLYDFAPEYFGGHSLGEYTALVAADVLPFSETLKIVRDRGHLMQSATPVGTGGMAAVMANDLDLGAVRSALNGLPIDIANDNSVSQVVVSGMSSAMPEAEKRIKTSVGDSRSFHFIPLNVSAPFHSRFMGAVRETFGEILCDIEAKLRPANAKKVTSNFTGLFHSDSRSEIIDRMVSQISNTVQWRKNMETLAASANSIFEIGPSRPLRGFFKTIDLTCQSITTFSAAQRVFEKAVVL
ncbi:MAG: ACP S-malonyltransferase [Deltaproteobacteria bacterium]|nr:ACP S-malonyltransferase [Deltaproteobacteria bacterium]MBW2599029.1 ACP S-malonyltransferase [Deltaproteobacteria bacterium]